MRLLVIGGTRFVGRHVVEAALRRGHEVTLLHRTPSDLFPGAEHVLADRDGSLAALDGREFDATADMCAYFPRQVRHVVRSIATRSIVFWIGRFFLNPTGPLFIFFHFSS